MVIDWYMFIWKTKPVDWYINREDYINSRALDLRNLGPKFGPIPKAKKYVFFPILDEKFPI